MYIINEFISFISFIADNLGTFCNRVVECCCKKKPKQRIIGTTDDLINLDGVNLKNRKIDYVSTQKADYEIIAEENAKKGIKTIKVNGSSPHEIVKNYILDFQRHPSYQGIPRLIFSTGFLDSSKQVHQLNLETWERLKTTGFYYIENNRILLPLMGIDQFELFDNLSWFKSEVEIQKKFKTIADAHRNMLMLLKTILERTEKFGFREKISTKNLSNVNGFRNAQTANERKNKQIIRTGNDANDRKLRLQHKLREKVADKQQVLEDLKHFQKLLNGSMNYSSVCPSTANAYMLFENISNSCSDIMIFCIKLINNTYLRTEIFDYTQDLFHLFAESLELLLPHATKITKAFNINLINDGNLNCILEPSQKPSESAISDFEEHKKIKQGLRKIKQLKRIPTASKQETLNKRNVHQPEQSISKTNRTKQQQHPQATEKTTGALPIDSSRSSGIDKIEDKKPTPFINNKEDDKGKEEQRSFVLPAPKKREKNNVKEQSEGSRLIAWQEQRDNREKRIAERRAIRAEAIVNNHKTEQTKHKEIEQTKRQNTQIKIHELPSEELVWDVILPGLNNHHTSLFNIFYGLEEYHNQIRHKQVVNLTQEIYEALVEYDIGCAKDFYNYVISRIHIRHDADTGDLLPKHYIDILRSCFIIFGIFPKDWKPKTEEDFDAMEKYYQRKLDYFYWESRMN